MKYLGLLLSITLPASTWRSDGENRAADEQVIRRTLSAFSDARNAFDARAIADLFTPDGESRTTVDTINKRKVINAICKI